MGFGFGVYPIFENYPTVVCHAKIGQGEGGWIVFSFFCDNNAMVLWHTQNARTTSDHPRGMYIFKLNQYVEPRKGGRERA